MKTIIDYDSACYAIASACDGSKWNYKGRQWDLKNIAISALEAEGKDPKELYQTKDPEPWENVETTIEKYTDDFVNSLPNPFDTIFLIGGGSNFRYDIATIQPYKGNRVLEKPYHLEAIRNYVCETYDAKRVYGVETDDAVGILYEEGDTIVSQDKDLDQYPGKHFHPIQKKEYTVSEVEGLQNFYCQVLLGDQSDHILGIFGLGKSSSYLKDIKKMNSEEEMYGLVSKIYKQRFGNHYKLFLLETCRLLWLLRSNTESIPLWMNELMEDTSFYTKTKWEDFIFVDARVAEEVSGL